MRSHLANQIENTDNVLQALTESLSLSETQPGTRDAVWNETRSSTVSLDQDALILQHMASVRFIARRIAERLPQHVELDDLISAGLVGLLDAASKFDLSKQVQFKSYAQFRIRGAILDSLRVLDWSPRELRRKGREMAEAIRSLSTKLGRTPADAEIAQEMGMALVTFQQMTGELKGTEIGSLDVEYTEDAGETEIAFIAAPSTEDPLALCIQSQNREQLAAAIEALPEKERLVLTLSYYEELTLKEIGMTIGVVESRVSQIRSAAVTRLRGLLKASPARKGSPKGRNRVQ